MAGDGLLDGDGRRDGQFRPAAVDRHRFHCGDPGGSGAAVVEAVPDELAALIAARRVGGGLDSLIWDGLVLPP